MSDWKDKELVARRAIEDQRFIVHDANVLFRENCPNIDLVVYSQARAIYVQVKSSHKAAGKDRVTIDGSPWTEETLLKGKQIFNRHDHLQASLVVLVDHKRDGQVDFYIAPPAMLENLVRRRGLRWYRKLKKDGAQRSISFPKELERAEISQYRNAWRRLGKPFNRDPSQPSARSAPILL